MKDCKCVADELSFEHVIWPNQSAANGVCSSTCRPFSLSQCPHFDLLAAEVCHTIHLLSAVSFLITTNQSVSSVHTIMCQRTAIHAHLIYLPLPPTLGGPTQSELSFF